MLLEIAKMSRGSYLYQLRKAPSKCLDIVYSEQIAEDFHTLKAGFELLEYDYIGGSCSRGYGKIKLVDIKVNQVFPKNNDKLQDILKSCQNILSKDRN